MRGEQRSLAVPYVHGRVRRLGPISSVKTCFLRNEVRRWNSRRRSSVGCVQLPNWHAHAVDEMTDVPLSVARSAFAVPALTGVRQRRGNRSAHLGRRDPRARIFRPELRDHHHIASDGEIARRGPATCTVPCLERSCRIGNGRKAEQRSRLHGCIAALATVERQLGRPYAPGAPHEYPYDGACRSRAWWRVAWSDRNVGIRRHPAPTCHGEDYPGHCCPHPVPPPKRPALRKRTRII